MKELYICSEIILSDKLDVRCFACPHSVFHSVDIVFESDCNLTCDVALKEGFHSYPQLIFKLFPEGSCVPKRIISETEILLVKRKEEVRYA